MRRWWATCLALVVLNSSALEINTATQAQLEQVKGIGVAMSERLLKARTDGRFIDWQDLMARVAGMAPRSARRLSDQGVTVADQPFVPIPAAPVPAASR